jgi:hypothetical protein
VILPLVLAALPCVYWDQGVEAARESGAGAIPRLCVPAGESDAFRAAGLSAVPVDAADLAAREPLPAPGIRVRPERASATRSPWIDASGWRFRRRPEGRYVYDVPPEAAPLAAAEAFAHGADAVIRIGPGDPAAVAAMLEFLAALPAADLPEVADFAVVEDGSPLLGEVMNLLARRNLLFRVVPAPTAELDLNVKLGSADFPMPKAADPSALALQVRRRLTDERRSLRIFGTESVIARLTAGGGRTRLHLLNYSGRELEGLRIRLRGPLGEGEARVAGLGPQALEERIEVEGATEFSLDRLTAYGVVDFPPVR